ncbi:hypothetical protein [Pedosphaera parvula]|uniref:Uncharacterized protein n=1 Tax=Pedosphaera parvula (strain Ellin514) TaxID=320771 RepID=B9X9N3_PEDPL|nr:hypothetical protein [Pedosphaera parvula]EEF63277.1 conserved hypothetical protein, DUF407 family [Pedosphaera parvula Ellin514]
MNTLISPVAEKAAERAHHIRDTMPNGGLFAGHDWRVSPAPFHLGAEVVKDLEKLGRVLLQFNKAVNRLYRLSIEGKQPAWIAEWLDHGKPAELVELQRSAGLKNEWPRVIRPDLLITDSGLQVTELDSVPGGIGLTAWLNQTYSHLGMEVVGGGDGMLKGFASIFGDAPNVHLVISEESATYRPEMAWLAQQLGENRFKVQSPGYNEFKAGDAVYRFFELFDAANVPSSVKLFDCAKEKQIRLTPPPKPIFEEKMLFALLWNRNLQSFWRQELGESFLNRMLKLVPYTWMVDPSPMPPQAAIPELNLTDWNQLKTLSQKERELILKVSGFSPNAWGARGVSLGSDLSHAEWSEAVDRAITSFPTSPYILQRYEKPSLVQFQWFDFQSNKIVPMPGRVRLCPYYFVSGEGDAARATLGGVLATVCPADKKIIHGMPEAVFAPGAI